MYSSVPAWAVPLLRTSHGVQGRVWASVNGSSFAVPMQLRQGGTIGVDGTSPIRRTLSCELVADVESPSVSPIGTELFVEYGLIFGLRTVWVPAGVFVITEATETSLPGVVKIKGEDRWRRVVDARFESAVTTSGNTAAAIVSLVQGADSRITVTNLTGSSVTHVPTLWERDRDDAVLKLCKTIDAQMYFDPSGNGVLKPAPVLPTAGDVGVWTIGRGAGGAKVSSARSVSRDGVYTGAVVTGEPLDGGPPVWAFVPDSSPASITRHGGPFGKKPNFYKSPFIRSSAQAAAVATTRALRVTGIAWEVALTALPHPALEYGDPLRIEVAANSWQTHMLEGYTLPLGPGVVSFKTRSTAAAVDGE